MHENMSMIWAFFNLIVSLALDPLGIYGTKYSSMDQVNFVKDNLQKILKDMAYLSRPYPFQFFKGCLPQIWLSPFLNTLSNICFSRLATDSLHLSTASSNGTLIHTLVKWLSAISHANPNAIPSQSHHRCKLTQFSVCT